MAWECNERLEHGEAEPCGDPAADDRSSAAAAFAGF